MLVISLLFPLKTVYLVLYMQFLMSLTSTQLISLYMKKNETILIKDFHYYNKKMKQQMRIETSTHILGE